MSQGEKGKRIKNAGSGNFRRRHFCVKGYCSACTAIMIAEMMGVEAGLGWYMTWAKSWAAYNKMFAALFVICFIFTIVI